MAELNRPSEIRLRDPLSAVTRTERRTLLGVSALGIVIAKSGLVPSKINALGIEFDHADQRALLKMLSAIVTYFLIAFLIYAASDLVAWRIAFHHSVIDWRRSRRLVGEDEILVEREVRDEFPAGRVWVRVGSPVALFRALFEFAIPIMIGVYAVAVLLGTPPPLAR